MLDHDQAKHLGDGIAIGLGSLGTLAQWSNIAGQITPILSMLFVGASLLWVLVRIFDRFRYGPDSRGD